MLKETPVQVFAEDGQLLFTAKVKDLDTNQVQVVGSKVFILAPATHNLIVIDVQNPQQIL